MVTATAQVTKRHDSDVVRDTDGLTEGAGHGPGHDREATHMWQDE